MLAQPTARTYLNMGVYKVVKLHSVFPCSAITAQTEADLLCGQAVIKGHYSFTSE